MKIGRFSLGQIVVIVMLVIHLIPVWCFTYFPTQDGASHIYNAYVLKEYHDHANFRLREVYELNRTFFPNWTSHALLFVLMHVLPPIMCEKIVLTLCIGLLPLSLFYFLKGVKKENSVLGLVGFIFAYNYLLHMGFYNFVLSMSMFFFTLGYWWRIKHKLHWKNIILLYLLLILTYFTHYHSYALLLISLTFLSLFWSLYESISAPVIQNRSVDSTLQRFLDFIKVFKPTLTFIVVLIPAFAIMLSYYLYLVNTHGSEGDYRGIRWLIDYFFSMKSLVSFRDAHVLIGQFVLTLMGVVFCLSVVYRIRSFIEQNDATGKRSWVRFAQLTDGFLILSALITLMFFVAPWSGYSGGWINDRFHLYIFLTLLPFFAISMSRRVNYIVAGMLILLSLIHFGFNVHTYMMLNRDIREALSLEGMDERHTVLGSLPGEWRGMSDSLGFEPKYVEPFGHIECLLAVNMGIAYLNNYEANTDHFPLRYKNKDITADYIIVWRTEYEDVEGLEQEYELIDSNNYNRLYRLKQTEQGENLLIGSDGIAFDLQPQGAQTAPGHIPIYPDTRYRDGLVGWVTDTESDGLFKQTDIIHSYQDSIVGEEDGVFKVILPNGAYKVVCYFSASGTEPLEVNLIANGAQKIKELQIPIGSNIIMKHYNIEIKDEFLTQVIYTRGKAKYKRWGWSSFSIQKR